MTEKKNKKTRIILVDRVISITTPTVSVHIETKDSDEDLKELKKIAESIIDKYGRQTNE